MEYDSNKILDNLLEIVDSANVTAFDDDTAKFLIDYASLPRKNQIDLLNKFLESLEFYKHFQVETENREKCFKEGHIYADWYERVSFKSYKGSTFKNKIWCKECRRCGDFVISYVEPKEIVKLREEKSLEEQIDVLQRKLTKLRKGE